jgi:hypothetical protein
MLAKCTNPSCSASFLHLDGGRLFRLESDRSLGSSKAMAAEYFWLCKGCSSAMTLRLAQDGTVVATGLQEAPYNAPQLAVISLNRGNGLCLRSVTFLRSSHPRCI